ncbi:hypothetical protein Unana1_06486 [Umbelopsis nana]
MSDNHQYDAYAGQYPPPHPPATNTQPPAQTQYFPVYPPEQSLQDLSQPYPGYQDTHNAPLYPPYQEHQYQHNIHYANDPNAQHINPPLAITTTPQPPQPYNTPPTQGPTSANIPSYANPSAGYSDPHSVPLNDYHTEHYLYASRNDVDTAALLSSHNNASPYGRQTQEPQPAQEEEDDFEEVLDMELQEPKHLVAPASYNRPDRDGFLPGERKRGAKPTTHGANDPESYLPKPYAEPRRGLCHGMSCCSIFCLLISVAFIVAGAVLTIYAKVAKGNCNQALQGASQVAQPLCDTVLYDALFYGGIAIMILAGIATLWRLIMCMCARGR